jgi:hypothetical protein
LVILLCKQKSYKAVYFIICAGLFIAVPWLIRNVIVSGYLIHPYPAIDLFNVDWKVPKEIALASNQYVKAFAITMEVWGTSNEYILNLPIGDKIQKWVAEKHPLDISIVAVGLLSVVLMAFSSLFKRRLAKDNIILVVLWIVGLCGFIFLLAMAPAVRFGYSFIAIVFAVPVYLLLKGKYNFLRFLPVNACLALTIIYLGILSVRYFRGIKEETYSYSELLWKPQGFESRIERFPFEQKTHIINGIQFTQPVDGGICYDCLLPCGYDMSGIEMRGTSLQDGFRKKEKQ